MGWHFRLFKMVDGQVDVAYFHEVEGEGVERVWGERKMFGKPIELNRTM